MYTKQILTVASIMIASATAPAYAAQVLLDLQVDPTAKTWNVYASLSPDNDGLASFSLDVIGEGGITVTSSQLRAPRPYSPALDDFIGFRLFRSNGTGGLEIRASQDTVSADEDLLLLGLGVTSPVFLASGDYAGDVGTLTASLHPGALFNVFPNGYVAGGATSAAAQVASDTVAVPEPAVLGLGGALLLLSGRRRRNKR